MAIKLNGPQYRLLYFQANPESGERVIVGMCFERPVGNVEIRFDERFQKLGRLFPGFSLHSARSLLHDLASECRDDEELNPDTLEAFAPHITASEAHPIFAPLSGELMEMLFQKFVRLRPALVKRESGDAVSKSIANLLARVIPKAEIRRNATSSQLLGHKIEGTKKIAVAIRSQNGWILADGVDLNLNGPKDAMTRADEVARTFWQYLQDSKGITTFGIVLNGKSAQMPQTKAAHDYAVHRLRAESNQVIDGTVESGELELQRVLNAPLLSGSI